MITFIVGLTIGLILGILIGLAIAGAVQELNDQRQRNRDQP